MTNDEPSAADLGHSNYYSFMKIHQPETAKNIHVYLNGDQHFAGRKIVVNRRYVPDFNGFLNEIKIHSRMNVSARWRKYVKDPCLIYVYGNGDMNAPAVRLLLIPRCMKTWDLVLGEITEKLSSRTGHAVRKLYDMEYRMLNDPSELESGQYYVAVGTEKLKKYPYGEIHKPQPPRKSYNLLPPIKRAPKQKVTSHDDGNKTYTKMYAQKKSHHQAAEETVVAASAVTNYRPLKMRQPDEPRAPPPTRPTQPAEEDSLFLAKPVKVKRSGGKVDSKSHLPVNDVDGVFRSRHAQINAEEVSESDDVKVDLPIDQVPADIIEEENIARNNTEQQPMITATRTLLPSEVNIGDHSDAQSKKSSGKSRRSVDENTGEDVARSLVSDIESEKEGSLTPFPENSKPSSRLSAREEKESQHVSQHASRSPKSLDTGAEVSASYTEPKSSDLMSSEVQKDPSPKSATPEIPQDPSPVNKSLLEVSKDPSPIPSASPEVLKDPPPPEMASQEVIGHEFSARSDASSQDATPEVRADHSANEGDIQEESDAPHSVKSKSLEVSVESPLAQNATVSDHPTDSNQGSAGLLHPESSVTSAGHSSLVKTGSPDVDNSLLSRGESPEVGKNTLSTRSASPEVENNLASVRSVTPEVHTGGSAKSIEPADTPASQGSSLPHIEVSKGSDTPESQGEGKLVQKSPSPGQLSPDDARSGKHLSKGSQNEEDADVKQNQEIVTEIQEDHLKDQQSENLKTIQRESEVIKNSRSIQPSIKSDEIPPENCVNIFEEGNTDAKDQIDFEAKQDSYNQANLTSMSLSSDASVNELTLMKEDLMKTKHPSRDQVPTILDESACGFVDDDLNKKHQDGIDLLNSAENLRKTEKPGRLSETAESEAASVVDKKYCDSQDKLSNFAPQEEHFDLKSSSSNSNEAITQEANLPMNVEDTSISPGNRNQTEAADEISTSNLESGKSNDSSKTTIDAKSSGDDFILESTRTSTLIDETSLQEQPSSSERVTGLFEPLEGSLRANELTVENIVQESGEKRASIPSLLTSREDESLTTKSEDADDSSREEAISSQQHQAAIKVNDTKDDAITPKSPTAVANGGPVAFENGSH